MIIQTLAVIQVSALQRCTRGGACCRLIPLSISPARLRQAYRWRYRLLVGAVPPVPKDDPVGFATMLKVRAEDELAVSSGDEPPYRWEWERVVKHFPAPVRDPKNGEDDVLEIWRMFEGRCLGKTWFKWDSEARCIAVTTRDDPKAQERFLFGPCAHLQPDEVGKPTCGIHAVKPYMCSVYPWTAESQAIINSSVYIAFEEPNPAFFRGCGFNLDVTIGVSEAEILAALVPLSEEEK